RVRTDYDPSVLGFEKPVSRSRWDGRRWKLIESFGKEVRRADANGVFSARGDLVVLDKFNHVTGEKSLVAYDPYDFLGQYVWEAFADRVVAASQGAQDSRLYFSGMRDQPWYEKLGFL